MGGVLLAHVKARIAKDPDRRYYMVGHSLGGGLAALVALEVGHVGVTFAPPGLSLTAPMLLPRHDWSGDEIANLADNLLYSVVQEKDIIPQIDDRLGSSIRLACRGSAFSCHHVQAQIAEMKLGGCKPHAWCVGDGCNGR